jgi:4-nitrophenyl phosphatase
VLDTLESFNLTVIRAVLLDMDGVLWRGAETIPGAPEFIDFLREHHIPFGLATNNSSRDLGEYVSRCAQAGITVTEDQIISSGLVTADELARNYPVGTPIHVVGSASLTASLVARGYPLAIDPNDARVLIVGIDTAITYQKLTVAMRCILNGAAFIGTNSDATFPAADGLSIGAGSLIASLENATGQRAQIMGKPAPAMFRTALSKLGTDAAHTLMIGDRLDTDILGAQQAGLRAAAVLTGITNESELNAPDQLIKPDAVYADLFVLRDIWEKLI